MNLRVAIVGAGRMGRERAHASTALGARVVAICDPDSGRASELASPLRARVLNDPSEIDWGSLDAVFVCTPPGARGPAELAAIEAGVPLFVEKPVGLSAEQVLPALRALRSKPVVNAAGYMNRYRESVLRARRMLEDARPLALAFHWIGTRYRVPWWLMPGQSGGPLNEQCTHLVDLCRFLVGEIATVQVSARPLPDAPEVDGTVALTIRFRNGMIGTGLYACEALKKQIAFEVFLPERSVRLEGWDLQLAGFAAANEDIYVKETAAFFRAISSGDRSAILSGLESAIETQSVIDAIRRAAKSQLPEPAIAPADVHGCA